MREFFAGSNTPLGFYSYFDQLLCQQKANKIICIKGGAGTGKSSAMKNFAAEMLRQGHSVELGHCSSDPHSLDAVVITDLSIMLVDATAPHIVDPKNPGAVDEIFNMGDFWDESAIKTNKSKIMECNEEISTIFKRCYNYLAGAKNVTCDTDWIYAKTSDFYGVSVEFDKIRRLFEAYPISRKPTSVRKLFISAITPEGNINYSDKTAEICKRVIGINASEYAYCHVFMEKVMQLAIERGFTVEAFYCPMSPNEKIEHLYIEEMGYYFTTCNRYHSIICDEIIDFSDYVNRSTIKNYNSQLLFNEEISSTLVNQAIKTLKNAKACHDELEKYYIPSMDFARATIAFNKKMQQIVG